VRHDDPDLLGMTLWTPPDGRRSSVLIVGARRGDVFVATELLICADSLGDEDAIRAWLARHDVHVAPALAHKGSARVGGQSGTARRTWTADDQRAS
jgi:hypothetical protein